MTRITVTTDNGSKDLEIDQDVFLPDRRGEYLDDETKGLILINAVADALKELNEGK